MGAKKKYGEPTISVRLPKRVAQKIKELLEEESVDNVVGQLDGTAALVQPNQLEEMAAVLQRAIEAIPQLVKAAVADLLPKPQAEPVAPISGLSSVMRMLTAQKEESCNAIAQAPAVEANSTVTEFLEEMEDDELPDFLRDDEPTVEESPVIQSGDIVKDVDNNCHWKVLKVKGSKLRVKFEKASPELLAKVKNPDKNQVKEYPASKFVFVSRPQSVVKNGFGRKSAKI